MAKVTSNIGELNARTFKHQFTYAGAPSLPSTVHWRLTCPDVTDAEVVAWTEATITTETADDGVTEIYTTEITIPATAHAMRTANDSEQRLYIVAADKDLATEWNEEWIYYVEAREARS